MVLEIQGVSKTYRKNGKKALDQFSAQLTPGVYGLLGPNGAGKSTLMNIITGNLTPDCGSVTYNGHDTADLGSSFRKILGYMPQQQGVYDDFTATRFLWYMAALKGLSRAEAKAKIPQLLKLVNLQNAAYKRLGSFSGGMKQRILIAQALLNDPEVLILDEPTAGLDPKERIRIRNFISEIALNKIVIYATHVVSDIEYIAKDILLLKEGKLLFHGTTQSLLNTLNGKVFETIVSREQVDAIQQKFCVSGLSGVVDGVKVRFVADHLPTDTNDCHLADPTLEDVYLYNFRDNINDGIV